MQLGDQPLHFFLEWFAVVLLHFGADVAARGEDVVMLADFIRRCTFAETGDVRVLACIGLTAPGVVGLGDAGDVVIGQFPVGAVHHAAQLTGVNEQDFTATVACRVASSGAGQEPQAGGNLRRIEELSGQRHHAVHQIRLNQVFANNAFVRLVRRHGAVGEHEAGGAGGRQMMDDVLHPGEVGVALGRYAVLPALVVEEPLAAPVGDVERRIGKDEVGFEVGMAVVEKTVVLGNLAVDAANRKVHLRQPPRGMI